MLANPKLTEPDPRDLRRSRARRFLAVRAPRGPRQRQRVPAAVSRGQASQQAGAGAADRRAAQHQDRSVGAVRRADQAHPRIQAAIAQHPRSHRAVPGDQGRTAARLGAAGEDLRRQGGGELSLRQADHQADQRRRRSRQQRSRRRRAAEGRLPRRLQCQPRGSDHSGRRSVRADLDRRHGGLRHRQHEAGAQRRADHRHARRRQYRNPRRCRRGEHRDLRPGGRRRHDPAQAGAGCDRRHPPLAAAGAGDHRDRERRVLARRSRPLRLDRPRAALSRPLHGVGRFRFLLRGAARHRRALAGGAGLDPRLDPQRGADAVVLFRPHHPRICRGDLERAGACGGARAGAGPARGEGVNSGRSGIHYLWRH